MNFIQIVPEVSPAICGVGDYALILARKLRASRGWITTFAVSQPNPGQTEIEGFPVLSLEDHSAKSVAATLASFDLVLLHYVSYGYQKRGCPRWLHAGLAKWRQQNPENRLLTMFHELYATESPARFWKSAFWTSPIQFAICQDLSRLSDSQVTNRQDSSRRLTSMSGVTNITSLPVFSNIGEPDATPPMAERKNQLVIFGGRGWRTKALTVDLPDLQDVCRRWQIEEVLEIGGGETPEVTLDVSMRKLGPLDAEDVSAHLLESRYGFSCCPSDCLEKSGVFAAYAAHGVAPVLPKHHIIPESLGINASRHLRCAEEDPPDLDRLETYRQDVFSWYQTHTTQDHAKLFEKKLEALKSAVPPNQTTERPTDR